MNYVIDSYCVSSAWQNDMCKERQPKRDLLAVITELDDMPVTKAS